MSELKRNLEALRLDDEAPRSSRWKWVTVAVALVVAVGAGLAWWGRDALAATEVGTVQPTVQESAPGAAGAPILTASGYVVARRKAVVSAKIQGRLSDLRVEEGSRVREGEIVARLESADYEAAVNSARARVEASRSQIDSAAAGITRAEADLMEANRQMRLADRLAADRVVSEDSRDAAPA